MKKFYSIITFACIGALGMGITACGGKADYEGSGKEIALVSDVDIAGMSGVEIMKLIGINSDDDISSLTIKENKMTDVSWADKFNNITVSDRDKIEDFYARLSNIVLENEVGVENSSRESDAPKEREIEINTKSGEVYSLHYNPMTKTISECLEKDGFTYEWMTFETLSDDFNDWLIKLCDVDISADYTSQYEKYNAAYEKQRMLHENEDEEWFGGTEVMTDAKNSVLKVFICGDMAKGKENAGKKLKDTSDVVFEKANISYSELKKIKDEISEKIEKDNDKYSFVTFCGLMSKDISIGVSEEASQKDIDNLLEYLAEYKEYISLTQGPSEQLD